jgi:hypothetical protein
VGECVNNLMDTNKYHAAAQHMMSLLKLHAKVDHMRMEDDWRKHGRRQGGSHACNRRWRP